MPRFCCEKCNFITDRESNYNKHLMTAKHKKPQKTPKNPALNAVQPSCGDCVFIPDKENNFNKHLLTAKNKNPEQCRKKCAKYICEECDFESYNKKDFTKHSLTAKHIRKFDITTPISIIEPPKDYIYNMIRELVAKNIELTNSVIESNNKIVESHTKLESKITNNSITNNVKGNQTNHNKFNLNFFLNETCKDAFNMSDFLNTIQVSIEDLENTVKLGYTLGITKIITDRINEMGMNKRPFHCTDLKRDIVYVKDNDIWEKDDAVKPKMKRLAITVTHRGMQTMGGMREHNPDCIDCTTKAGNDHINMMHIFMGGQDSDMKDAKIYKNVLKEIVPLQKHI